MRVAIFNDSPTVRALLRATLHAAGDFDVVVEAEDGRDAVAVCRDSGAELVLMDVVMPHVDGLTATRSVVASLHIPVIVVSEVIDVGNPDELFAAMRAGAVFVIAPPGGSPSSREARSFVQVLRNILGEAEAPPSPTLPRALPLTTCALLGVAASAGGPGATADFLRVAAVDLPPTVLVQHLADGFAESYARWLTETSGVAVRVAAGGEELQTGVVFIAPSGRHILVAEGRILLTGEPEDAIFRPSADVLFGSLPGPGTVAVVLSGMGDDGARGACALRKAGGRVWVQDEQSCAVYGMPRAARALAGADLEGSPEMLGQRLKGAVS